ncbi:hypothetical protein UPYG_G00032180 [Umbra pygmaea]|uniref:Fibronectin type-III domain-containing protein n=1 Tax=Umbra pygmaea TaxID=75934 RepID=A0ABD0YC16_UMBPY
MLTFLLHVLITWHGVGSVEPMKELPCGEAVDLPWQTELCCSSPPASLQNGAGRIQGTSDTGHPHTSQCLFRNSTSRPGASQEIEHIEATCWDILCSVDETGEHLICDLYHRVTPSSTSTPKLLAVSLQYIVPQQDRELNGTDRTDCVGEESFSCSISLHPLTSIIMVTTTMSGSTAEPSVMLGICLHLARPSPPVNLTHTQTTDGELVLRWNNPPSQWHASPVPLIYQIGYKTSQNTSDPNWKLLEVTGKNWVFLTGFTPHVNYYVQVRSHPPALTHLMSDWSRPHLIHLNSVTFLPERVLASLGENVTLYCVLNDYRVNTSMAVWIMNNYTVPQVQYTAVNDRVSRITVQPSEQRLFDILRCCKILSKKKNICKYDTVKIYIKARGVWAGGLRQVPEGSQRCGQKSPEPVINISCVTSENLDVMTCSWKNSHPDLTFLCRVTDVSCDVMREADRVGQSVSVFREEFCFLHINMNSCTLQPIRPASCYKLWMEDKTYNGTKSQPVYITPLDNVKPHPPSIHSTESLSSGVLRLEWKHPETRFDIQYQVRYAVSTVMPTLSWQVLESQRVSWAEISNPVVCEVYQVQVRCKHVNKYGPWSDWSKSVYTARHNSRAPEKGPDFWRVVQEDPTRMQTKVTLLLNPFTKKEPTYCVEGLVIELQASGGAVHKESIGLVPSYSFEWNDEVHFVTVKAQNSKGTSTRNTNMTLVRHPKHQCASSLSASRVNRSCVVLSWSLQGNRSMPWSLVVEWWGQSYQDGQGQPSEGRGSWIRVPPDQPIYLHGNFYGFEEYVFVFYPVFVDGEGHQSYTKVFKERHSEPAVFMFLMIITFLSIVFIFTLVICQKPMKKYMWKEVPNPNNCSWAQGMDFRKAETLEQLFHHTEDLPAWPLLDVSEFISQATVLEKTSSPDKYPSALEDTQGQTQLPSLPEVSAQLSVTYTTVRISEPPPSSVKQAASLSSFSDEGNYSANTSDNSDSFPRGLWELESSREGVSDWDPQHSCSDHSVEEVSEHKALGVWGVVGKEGTEMKDPYQLGMGNQKESGEQEDIEFMLLKQGMDLGTECLLVESYQLLGCQDSKLSPPSDKGAGVGIEIRTVPMYLPQLRTTSSYLVSSQDSTPSW